MASGIKTQIKSYSEIIDGYNPENNISRNTLTRYEKTLIIGMRLEQLARGARPYVSIANLKDEKRNIQEIVKLELREKAIPFMVVRTMPNGEQEYWKLSDMIITDT